MHRDARATGFLSFPHFDLKQQHGAFRANWVLKDGHKLGLVAHDLPVGMRLMWCVEAKGRHHHGNRFSPKCTDLATPGALGAVVEGEEDPVNEC
jgi:hypothetical protein